jgi:hypothetical protein
MPRKSTLNQRHARSMGPPEGVGLDSVAIQKKPAPFPVQAPKFNTLTLLHHTHL